MGGVLIVTPWYPPQVGGVAQVSERLRVGLGGAGVPTQLLVIGECRELRRHPELSNVWHTAVPGAVFSTFAPRTVVASLLRTPPTLWRLRRVMRAQDVRTAILVFPIHYAWAFLALRALTGLRVIASLHGSEVRRFHAYPRQLQWLIRRVLRDAAVITVPAEPLAEVVREILPSAASRIVVVPNAVDTDRFTPDGRDRDGSARSPTLVHISNFARIKRTVDLVDAFAAARLPAGARLVFVGTGPTLEATRARAEQAGVADRVEFVGPQADVRPFLHAADAVVLPSEIETAPLVLLEAMACGVTWIATRFGAAAETAPGECGIVVPAHSPAALAAAMEEMLRDPARAREMGRRGREIAVRDYSLTRYVARHLDILAR